jgi:hypothetical protein
MRLRVSLPTITHAISISVQYLSMVWYPALLAICCNPYADLPYATHVPESLR